MKNLIKIPLFIILLLSLSQFVMAKGADGANGKDGESFTIFANGQEEYLDVSGDDGYDGADGANGRDGTGWLTTFHENGGDGEAGGNGGNAGKTGSVTIYFKNLEDLKKIKIRAIPARGGRGGRGGSGGRGMDCRGWMSSDDCTPGRNGANGRSGQKGLDATDAVIKLIQKDEELYTVFPTTNVTLDKQERMVSLSQHLFEKKNGAKELFGLGSKIGDSYLLYKKSVELKINVKWDSEELFKKVDENEVCSGLFKKADSCKMVPGNSAKYSLALNVNSETGEVIAAEEEFLKKWSSDENKEKKNIKINIEIDNNAGENTVDVILKEEAKQEKGGCGLLSSGDDMNIFALVLALFLTSFINRFRQ